MIIYKSVAELEKHVRIQKKTGKATGFIPTMGALHAGHISLISASKKKGNYSVSSIFVNPSQFNNKSDFINYPITIESDIEKMEACGCDVLFLPSVKEIYPDDFVPQHYDLGYLENILEGKYRPGHFQGVSQVVDRFLGIIQPDELYLGEKDYQQCMVIKKLISLKGYNTKTIVHPTLRELDGLAMSSRNLRLNENERQKADKLHKALDHIGTNLHLRDINKLKNESVELLEKRGFRVDYIEIADAETLLPVSANTAKKVILGAAYLNEIRLIDNLMISS